MAATAALVQTTALARVALASPVRADKLSSHQTPRRQRRRGISWCVDSFALLRIGVDPSCQNSQAEQNRGVHRDRPFIDRECQRNDRSDLLCTSPRAQGCDTALHIPHTPSTSSRPYVQTGVRLCCDSVVENMSSASHAARNRITPVGSHAMHGKRAKPSKKAMKIQRRQRRRYRVVQ